MQYLIYSTIRSMQYLIYPTINLCYNLVITIIQIRPIAIGKMGPGVVHDWVSPMLGCRLGSFDLWKRTSSVELETHSNGRVLGIGQAMVWTSHVDSEYGDLSSTFGYVLSI
jgi:hypothetical protein